MSTSEAPAAWRQPFTVADQGVIDALPDELRATVERYSRQSTKEMTGDSKQLRDALDEISRGEDALERLRDLIHDLSGKPSR